MTNPKDQQFFSELKAQDTESIEMTEGIRRTLRKTLAKELYMDVKMVEDSVPCVEMGLDSITAVTWIRKINTHYGLSIAATKVYGYPTINDLAHYILKEGLQQGLFSETATRPERTESPITLTSRDKLPGSQSATESIRKTPSTPTLKSIRKKRYMKFNPHENYCDLNQHESTDGVCQKGYDNSPSIAVIGMSGKFPKSKTLAEYWDNISQARDCVSGIFETRWPISHYYDPNPNVRGKTNCKWMGAVEDADQFDPLFFRISPAEAQWMDPQQRIFLESAWNCIEDAGLNPASLSESSCGVFVGCAASDYGYSINDQALSIQRLMGGNSSILSGRISYLLNLRGPCMSIDTSCSSSLVAIAEACNSLTLKTCDLALTGGVFVISGPALHVMTSDAGMLSEDGRCFTFDHRANGFVPGEGVGVLLLKRLSDAVRDRDQIHGVIKGWGVNQDGRTNGITAPSGKAQSLLEKEVYGRFHINPETISLVEAHGTGTELGDPIEVEALIESFRSFTNKENYCALGSVKSNIGHLQAAAGVSGVIKILLSLRHKMLPPTIHFEELNPHIRLKNSPFYVNTELKNWEIKEGSNRTAAVSSFGFSGTNAHMVIEEYSTIKTADHSVIEIQTNDSVIIVLSARTKLQLDQRARDLVDFLHSSMDVNPAVDLQSLAYTLQTGREAMEERLGFIVSSINELKEKLESYFSTNLKIEDHYQGHARRNKDALAVFMSDEDLKLAIENWISKGKYSKILDLWVKGLVLDWNKLYGKTKPNRISLPTYPFARERYWISDNQDRGGIPGAGSSMSVIHPLLHENTSDEQIPESTGSLPSPPGLIMMTPVWDTVSITEEQSFSTSSSESILIIGEDKNHTKQIEKLFNKTKNIGIAPHDTIDNITWKLKGLAVDRIVWVASHCVVETLTEEAIINEQNRGILQVFRILKSLIALGYENQQLEWTLITFNSQIVKKSDAANPTHAGLQGFAGSMAKEYPLWKIRLIDLQNPGELPIQDIWKWPFDVNRISYAYREKEWFQQKLILINKPAKEKLPYRSQGVYVVIGGAGGIGEAWTQYMIEKYHAHIIWIGRRDKDDVIQKKIDRLSGFGTKPEYVEADACVREELQAAYDSIKKRYPRIDGVVHSAVGIFDGSLKAVELEDFQEILSVKIDISVRIAQVFQKESLDFLLFFSSIASFSRAGGMSGYSAGCTFKDSFALQLSKTWSCKVKVINWGYWGIGTGDAISEPMKKRLVQSGIRPIVYYEGMKALEMFLSSNLNQVAVLKTLQLDRNEQITPDEWISCYPLHTSFSITDRHKHLLEAGNKETSLKFDGGKNDEMEELLCQLLHANLRSTHNGIEFYRRWLRESGNILREKHYPVLEKEAEATGVLTNCLDDIWGKWEQAKEKWLHDSCNKTSITLVETCMRALPDILTGKQKATDVLFPNSSLKLVEGVYKGNQVADYFNEVLSNTLETAVQDRLREDSSAKIRILEIGAGTGATTSAILQKLRAYKNQIVEYCYTDVSRAFLFHAERFYIPQAPYLCTRIFNVELPIAEQNIPGDSYDFVIATNVLHATEDVRNSLRNAKALLHQQGLLLLNEISNKSILAHLTFGLLEGWWLSKDDVIRIPGSPGLYPETWETILEEEGFHSVLFPAKKAHNTGQQIIIATSDGIVRQKTESKPKVIRDHEASLPNVSEHSHMQVDGGCHDQGKLDELLCMKTIIYFKKLIAEILKMEIHQIDSSEPLESYGIDSIVIGEVNNRLHDDLGDITSTLLFEYQTIDSLTEYFMRTQKERLRKLLSLDKQSSKEIVASGLTNHSSKVHPGRLVGNPVSSRLKKAITFDTGSMPPEDSIAIIGISGMYPQAETLEHYWHNLKTGRDCITEILANRWSLDGFYHPDRHEAVELGRSYNKWGGFVNQFAEFDPLFFNISPIEAMNMDPQERLFLQASWNALEDAGYTRTTLKDKCHRRVGVFAGITRIGYALYGPELWKQGYNLFLGTSFSSVANRLSYFLNVQGPSMPIDTMCSSSLTAIHEACEHIHRGECDLALAGGVNLYIHPSSYFVLCAQKMLSSDGQSKSFGAGGNGFVPGEGVGVVLLKSLNAAIRDQDVIHAVIRATKVNHGGKTNGYTVPNPRAQAELIRSTLDKAGISARNISYIEAHGTGTELGDPIEIEGLSQAFQKDTKEVGFCRIGSAKSNIGHLEAAAGIAGLTKIILQMKYGEIVPSLHSRTLNPNIAFEKTPFIVNQELVPWKRPKIEGRKIPRISGISSFGAGGANAHVVLEEYTEESGDTNPVIYVQSKDPVIIVLSARGKDQIKQRASDLLEFLRRPESMLPNMNNDDSIERLDIKTQLEDTIVGMLANLLNVDKEALDPVQSFSDYGVERIHMTKIFDSICQEHELELELDEWIKQDSLETLLQYSFGDEKESIVKCTAPIPDVDLQSLAYTLQTGREAMEERLGFIVTSIKELKGKLEAYISGKQETEDFYQGQVKRNKETLGVFTANEELQEAIEKLIQRRKFPSILDLWVKGLALDWKKLYVDGKPKRISLPTYPFAKERYWLPEALNDVVTLKSGTSVSLIHPLLHENTSDFREQRFTSTFTGKEFFSNYHKVNGVIILPGVCHLEMARAAVEKASGDIEKGTTIHLKNVVWADLIVIDGATREVHIGLFGEDSGSIQYEIYTESDKEEGTVVHSRGVAEVKTKGVTQPLDIEQLKSQMNQGTLNADNCYRAFKEMGIDYGEEYRGILEIYQGHNQLLAKLSLPSSVQDTKDEYVLHPGLFDPAIQSTIGLDLNKGSIENGKSAPPGTNKWPHSPTLPAALESLELFAPCTIEMYAWVRYSVPDKIQKLDIDLCDGQGNICVRMRGFETRELNDDYIDSVVPEERALNKTPLEKAQMVCFEEVWQKEVIPAVPGQAKKTLICFSSDSGRQKEFHEYIQSCSPESEIVFISEERDAEKISSRQHYSIDQSKKESYRQVLEDIAELTKNIDAIVYVWPVEKSDWVLNMRPIVWMLQAIGITRIDVKELFLVGEYNNFRERSYLESWLGIERSIGMILTGTKVCVLMGSAQSSSQGAKEWPERIWNELHTFETKSVLYQGDERFVTQVRSLSLDPGKSLLKSQGTYLITGGVGGLGLLFAEYLVVKYKANLILTGRTPISKEKQKCIDHFQQKGSKVVYVQADISELEAMRQVMPEAVEYAGAVDGIFHAAGVEGKESLFEKDFQDFAHILSPKIQGTLNLDQLFKEDSLDFICYFSSSSAILGDFGACDYAVGNRFQMAYGRLTSENNSSRVKRVVINWPLWKEGGMGTGNDESTQFYLKTSGQELLTKEQGLTIFDQILSSEAVQTLVLLGHPKQIERFLGINKSPLPAAVSKVLPVNRTGRAPAMRGLTIEQCVVWQLKETVHQLLKVPEDQIDMDENLSDFGFDSITLAAFARDLSAIFSIEITPSLFFGYPTLEKVTRYLMNKHDVELGELYRDEEGDLSNSLGVKQTIISKEGTQRIMGYHRIRSRARVSTGKSQEKIAIIGMSGRFPQSRNIEELWQLLAEGKEAVREIPIERFDWREYYDESGEEGRIQSRWSGSIEGVAEFDPLFFEISPREAELMDPRQRLLLQESWKALEDAGYGKSQLDKNKIGMFVGVEQGDYQLLNGSGSVTSNHDAVLATRLAYFLNLRGPVMAINTACSSGLVAAHQACLSLKDYECDTAIAAGVNLLLTPASYIAMSSAGMLSKDGKSYTFDNRANGMVPGDAVAVVVLKRLDKAEADGDPIYGVIAGSGINYDGKTNGITAPCGVAQKELLTSVYTRSHTNPEDIEYIVTHGTGTKLGDPVEINALYDAFRPFTKKRSYCALTSTKANLGHSFAASGLVSLISLVQALRHHKIPASLHCKEGNDYIKWDESPFFVNKETRDWPEPEHKRRLGAVSAFGMSGTNAHMLVEEYRAKEFTKPTLFPYYILPFSAKTDESLRAQLQEMIQFLESGQLEEEQISQLSFTLQSGRHHWNHRFVLVIKDLEMATSALNQALNGEKLPFLFQNKVDRNFEEQKVMKQYIVELLEKSESLVNDPVQYQETLYGLSDFYCQGYAIDWSLLIGGTTPKRLHIPTYSFAREKYWITET
ncbi:MAG: SDR family NAD(P)-dependent oxidoreductase, partial [Planctomycetes bacterium]|nr:SDR family NAD(P)-dependent oxidoreductase [Planctomycetota bacterium]